MEHTPSKLALAFFHWFCHPDFQEEIEGDLLERYQIDSANHGHRRANWLFIKEVLLLCRPSLMGNIQHILQIKSMTMTTQNKRLVLILAAVPVLLLIPLIAMQFSNGVDWKILDFIIMGILLSGTGLLCELVLRKVKSVRGRLLICATVLFAFFLLWAELAVGIFGSPLAGQ